MSNSKPKSSPSPKRSASTPPPPPPLPPAGAANTKAAAPSKLVDRPSPYLDKLASMPADYLFQRPEPRPYVYDPVYYFFYGTLMKPEILKGVLGLAKEPVLRSAKIYGSKLSKWGQYPALVEGEPGTVVTGCAYMVQSVEEEYKLAYYETNAYTLASYPLYLEGSDLPVYCKVFKYAGDAQALEQGRFDRKLWEMQMGGRLPPQWKTT